ncbi:MAG TPA: PIN domain-containing protein, partial [Geobacterales bacterium]|nr:PIN domain-containing protein [Geobacterales bacterium]
MKSFVLDTNVLLHDPQAVFKFQEHEVIIPITVIEEIDRFKKDLNETGRNARQFSRFVDDLRKQGSLATGVTLSSGGTLRVQLFDEKVFKRLPPELREERGDNRILAVAVEVKERDPNRSVIFVTKDMNLRIKADTLGLVAEDYESGKVDIDELYLGYLEQEVAADTIDRFYGQGWVELAGDFRPNQFITMRDGANPSHTAIGRFDLAQQRVVHLNKIGKEGVWSIQPRNREQHYALDILLND